MPLDGYYINLDRSDARRINIEQQVRALHLASTIRRFVAVDGATGGPFDTELENRTWACRQSHERVMDCAAAGSATIVFEDDIEISHAFSNVVTDETVQKFMENEPTTDIVFLECGFQWRFLPLLLAKADDRMNRRSTPSEQDAPERYDLSAVDMLDAKGVYSWSAAAYIVTPAGKRNLRRLFLSLRDHSSMPIDLLYKYWIETGELRGKIVVPFLATPHGKFPSTIEHAPSELLDRVPVEWVSLLRRILFAGDHGLDLTELEARMARYPDPPDTSPEYRLGIRAYERFRTSVRPHL